MKPENERWIFRQIKQWNIIVPSAWKTRELFLLASSLFFDLTSQSWFFSGLCLGPKINWLGLRKHLVFVSPLSLIELICRQLLIYAFSSDICFSFSSINAENVIFHVTLPAAPSNWTLKLKSVPNCEFIEPLIITPNYFLLYDVWVVWSFAEKD